MSLALCMMNVAGRGQSSKDDNGANQRTGTVVDLQAAISSEKPVPSSAKSSRFGPHQHFQG